VHGYNVAFAVSAVLFGIGVLVAVLLIPPGDGVRG
jgi:hypothetical protein